MVRSSHWELYGVQFKVKPSNKKAEIEAGENVGRGKKFFYTFLYNFFKFWFSLVGVENVHISSFCFSLFPNNLVNIGGGHNQLNVLLLRAKQYRR